MDTIDITLQNDYNDTFEATGVTYDDLERMMLAVRDTNPELYDVLRSAGYSLQPVED